MSGSQFQNQFEKVFIDRASLSSPLAERVHGLFSSDKISIVDGPPIPEQVGYLSANEFNRSKKLLYVRPHQGQFFKRCPGSSQKKVLNCCNYHVLNLGQQCNMNCSYCYLQSYLNSPFMTMYSNIDQALAEIKEMAEQHPNAPFRVGTGEVIDSLSLDEISLYSRTLIHFFKSYPKWTLEFKTKSNKVDQFLDCEHAGNVVCSWSINSDFIVRTEEHGTARLDQRLNAARKCKDQGFQIAFHLDPLIFYPDWKNGYSELVKKIKEKFLASEINVISIGTLRFQPEQRHLMRERFSMNSHVTAAEMFPSQGGKLRYDFRLRNEMYDFVLKEFKKDNDQNWRTFMCMETPESWISTYQSHPMQTQELKELFQPLPKLSSYEN